MINIMDVSKIKLSTYDYTRSADGQRMTKKIIRSYIQFNHPSHRGKFDSEVARLRRLRSMLINIPRQGINNNKSLNARQVPTSIMNLMIHVDGKLVSYRDLPIPNLLKTQLDNLPRFDYSDYEYTPRTLAE